MACGGCNSGRQYSSHRVRRLSNGKTRRHSSQANPIVFSERAHGGYKLQVDSQDVEFLVEGSEDREPKHDK